MRELRQIPSLAFAGRYDNFLIGEPADFAARVDGLRTFYTSGWMGGIDKAALKAGLTHGHMPSVALSDKFLTQTEHLFPAPTARHEMADDVVGAFPNVPAYIAGVPLNMRRKIKRENEFSPLAIIVDLTSSGGIGAAQIAKRGAAIMALLRALNSRRPVELWAGAGLNVGINAGWAFMRIETSPLDLARAAFILSHPAVSRGLLYSTLRETFEAGGSWPYGNFPNNDAIKAKYQNTVRQAFLQADELIYIPPVFLNDKSISDPVKWIGDYVKQFGGLEDLEN